MDQVHIINKPIFQTFEDISINIKPERLNIFIRKAQDLDLRPFLGNALYYNVISYVNVDGSIKDNTPEHFRDLIIGCIYQDIHGTQITYQGLYPMLVYFTFSRFIENDAIHYTTSGPVIKHKDNAASLNTKDIVKLVQQQRSIANAYANDVEKFLIDHHQHFPLWKYDSRNKSSRQAGPRIRAVDKTVFNYPSEYTHDNYLPLTDLIN